MSLSAAQRKFYFSGKFRPKNEVERIGPWKALCVLRGWPPKDDDKRYAAHESLGLPVSLTDWNNSHFNRFLTHVDRAWAAQHKTHEPARDRDRENALHAIRSLGLDEPYIESVSRDLYGLGCYAQLHIEDLQKLRNTLASRARSKAKRHYTLHPPGSPGFTTFDAKTQPNSENVPF